MSRTAHHKQQKHRHCGRDLWSRRAGMGYYSYCTENKKLTIRREREENRVLVREEIKACNTQDQTGR